MAEYITHLRDITHLCEKLFSMLGRKENVLSLCVYKILIRLWSELYLWCLAEFWLSISRNKISIMKNIWNSWKETGFGLQNQQVLYFTFYPKFTVISSINLGEDSEFGQLKMTRIFWIPAEWRVRPNKFIKKRQSTEQQQQFNGVKHTYDAACNKNS